LILSRPNGIIIKSAGTLFALPAANAARDQPEGEEPTEEGDEERAAEEKIVPTTSQLARDYAKAATRMVDAVGSDVRDLGQEHNVSSLSPCNLSLEAERLNLIRRIKRTT
jgi:dynein light chain roadblock-type